MDIRRLPGAPSAVALPAGTLYRIQLNAAPAAAWRNAFLHPPAMLTGKRYMPELGRLEVKGPGLLSDHPAPPAYVAPLDRPVDRLRQFDGGGVIET